MARVTVGKASGNVQRVEARTQQDSWFSSSLNEDLVNG